LINGAGLAFTSAPDMKAVAWVTPDPPVGGMRFPSLAEVIYQELTEGK
jgi:hypothetical protein